MVGGSTSNAPSIRILNPDYNRNSRSLILLEKMNPDHWAATFKLGTKNSYTCRQILKTLNSAEFLQST